MTLDNLELAFKFTGILSSGIFAGGAIYIGASQLPGILAMTDMDQALINFRYFWPRVRQMVSSRLSSYTTFFLLELLYNVICSVSQIIIKF